jgi:hypothetical protein
MMRSLLKSLLLILLPLLPLVFISGLWDRAFSMPSPTVVQDPGHARISTTAHELQRTEHSAKSAAATESREPTYQSNHTINLIWPTDHAITWFTVLLVIVGFVQVFLVWKTITYGRLSERAWVSIDVGPISGLKELGDFQIDPTPLHQNPDLIMRPMAKYRWINSGKTPARIVEARLEFKSVVERDLPPAPSYGPSKLHPILLAPFRPMETQAYLPLDVDHIFKLLAREEIMIFYGYIKYLDVHGKPHETRFCQIGVIPEYPIVPVYFTVGGPEAYNRFT